MKESYKSVLRIVFRVSFKRDKGIYNLIIYVRTFINFPLLFIFYLQYIHYITYNIIESSNLQAFY